LYDLLRTMIDAGSGKGPWINLALPPRATVTLEQVQQAGEWRAHGKTLKPPPLHRQRRVPPLSASLRAARA